MRTFYEFFAGGGMARAGLGSNWTCLLANDFDHKKAASYKRNWGGDELIVDDVRNISSEDMHGHPDLVWASFPCQDLSLAGGGAGLRGNRSGTFWPLINLLDLLRAEKRAPKIVALENVLGTLTSHDGSDFSAICSALHKVGYNFGALVVDASLFLPQSRPRLFIIAVDKSIPLLRGKPQKLWHTRALMKAFERLPPELVENWIWWSMPVPSQRDLNFSDLVENEPKSVNWHTEAETSSLLSMMSDVNLAKVEDAKLAERRRVGTIYKRTRYERGIKVQRAEVRFDDVAGCLRTPAGGSSRQLIMVVEGPKVRTRLISTRETARLMGLPESYVLPARYNEAYHLTGDGVAVPVVRYLAEHIIEDVILRGEVAKNREAA